MFASSCGELQVPIAVYALQGGGNGVAVIAVGCLYAPTKEQVEIGAVEDPKGLRAKLFVTF